MKRGPQALLPVALLVLGLSGLAGCAADGEARQQAAAADSALQRMAAELLPAVERGSGIESREPVRLARSDRAKLEAFLTEQLERDLPPERAEAVVASYARFGLLDPDLDLLELLRSLYLEQVAGYYDPAADTLFVRDDLDSEQLRPVLVHEMVHALQDRVMDLDSTMAARRDDNDALAAARAAVEGHATYVMMEWQLGQTTGRQVDLTSLPDLGGLLAGVDLSGAAGMPVLAEAPPLIRESLLFPYVGGLSFVQRLWRDAGTREPPLGAELPTSTEQVLHPERFVDDRDAPRTLSYDEEPPAGWSEVHQDGLGEFEVRHFLGTFLADSTRARSAARGWDADRYRLLREEGGEREVLVWVSAWDDADEASAFADAAADAFRTRYGDDARVTGPGVGTADDAPGASRSVEVVREERDGVAVVRVVDRPVTLDADRVPGLAEYTVTGAP